MPNKEKYLNYFDFEHSIKSGKIEPVYFVLSHDSYFLSKAGELLKEKFTGSKINNENYFLKYADDTTVEEILNLSGNFSSLFAQKKIIIVKKCEKYGKKIDVLLDYLKNPDLDTTLILAFDKEYAVEKKLDKTLKFFDFSFLPDKEYFKWLKSEFDSYRCSIDEKTINMFSDYIPRNFDIVVNEIKKVADYLLDSEEKVVTKEVILKLSGYEAEFTPIELMGSILSKNSEKSLIILDYLLNKELLNEVFLLSVMTNLFMDLMAVKNDNIQSMQNREFYLNYKIWGDRIVFVKKYQTYAKTLNFEQIFSKFIETDQKLKTSMIDPKVLFYSLIQDITSN